MAYKVFGLFIYTYLSTIVDFIHCLLLNRALKKIISVFSVFNNTV